MAALDTMRKSPHFLWLLAAVILVVAPLSTARSEEPSFVEPISDDRNPLIRYPSSAEWRAVSDRKLERCWSPALAAAARLPDCEWGIRFQRGLGIYQYNTYLNAARGYVDVGDRLQARHAYEQALRIWDHEREPQDPMPTGFHHYVLADHAEAHCEFALFLWRAGDRELSASEFHRARAYQPDNQCALTNGAALASGAAAPGPALAVHRAYNSQSVGSSSDIVAFSIRCERLREGMLSQLFGSNFTADQGLLIDERLARSGLASATATEAAESYRALASNPNSQPLNAAGDAYLQCLYGERLKELDPAVDLEAVLTGDYDPLALEVATDDPWRAALNRDGGQGATMLAEAANPELRARRELDRRAARELAEQRVAARRAQSEEFWSEFGTFALALTSTYVELETARQQQLNQAAQAPRVPPPSQVSNEASQSGGSRGFTRTMGQTANGCIERTGHNGGRSYFRNGCSYPVWLEVTFPNGNTTDDWMSGNQATSITYPDNVSFRTCTVAWYQPNGLHAPRQC